jgi:hypothetical protein
MLGKTKVTTFIFSLFILSGCEAQSASQSVVIQAKVDEFILDLLDRNEEKLVKKYLESSPNFSLNGKLTKDIANFLYNTDSKSGMQSVLNIVSKNNFRAKIIWQKEDKFTVVVIDESKYDKLNELSFLENEWMKQYFACEFILRGDLILLYQNVCFAETDGPFPVDDDV